RFPHAGQRRLPRRPKSHDPKPPLLPHLHRLRSIDQKSGDGPGHLSHVEGVYEVTGHTIDHRVCNSATPPSDYRLSAGACLEEDDAEALDPIAAGEASAGHDEDITCGVE